MICYIRQIHLAQDHSKMEKNQCSTLSKIVTQISVIFGVCVMWFLRLRFFLLASRSVQNRRSGCSVDEGRSERTELQQESRDDEILNTDTTAFFVKTTSLLSNSAKVEKANACNGGNMLCHVQLAIQQNTHVANHIRWRNAAL